MSDSKGDQFGQKPEETKKNPKVFGLRVKIEPYVSVQREQKKRKEETFDPFAVTYQGPKPEDF
ncbi:hypothetical protein [Vitiosangium sp. GDMCC 1.1324]|uniref:hypothetical protein n=1 Tax=Vitiosangium sp. (strain GDMCC 1.1324) TaxID=2138576 RepID=UPI000D34AEF5|nr:hypothetical protein [Vitiosangium sp. GDMCC 1.1324]PTL78802.1 hypothetical protein DAT35_37725 [Vitiosangium sp. GDMCC 1.1324]